jgi:hypothetical protein
VRLWETIRDAAEGDAGCARDHQTMDEAHECDRLVGMANGSVVAEETVGDVVVCARAVIADTDKWAERFERLERAGMPAALAGRTPRVPGASASDVERTVDGPPQLSEAPTTLEERSLEPTPPASGRSTRATP